MRCAASDNSAAAGESAGAPVELIGIAGDDLHVAHIDAELLGGHLREDCRMALALGADPGRQHHLAACLHAKLHTFIGPDSGSLDIADDADAKVPTRRASLRLLLLQEILIVDGIKRLLQNRRIVSTIINERRKILINDLIVVWKGIGRDKVATADFGAIEADLA